MNVDYPALEVLLKDATAHLNEAIGDLERAQEILPDRMNTILAQDRILTARKMVNKLRAHLDRQKAEGS